MRNPGSRPSRRKFLDKRSYRMSGPILAGALLLSMPGFAAAEDLPQLCRFRRCDSYLADRSARRSRARAFAGAPSHQHLHPLPQWPVPGREVPGRSRTESGRFRQPLVRRPAPTSAGRCLQPQSRNDHAVLLPDRRTGARRHRMARQIDPVGWADRGHGGVSRQLARIGSDLDEGLLHTTSVSGPRRQRGCAWYGAARDAATRRSHTRIDGISDQNRRGRRRGTDRKSKTRCAAAGRERQHRVDDGPSHQPDGRGRPRRQHPRLQREKPAAEHGQFLSPPRAGRAQISTRIRLADSQKIVAIAKLSDGSFWSATTDVVVTLAACTDELI